MRAALEYGQQAECGIAPGQKGKVPGPQTHGHERCDCFRPFGNSCGIEETLDLVCLRFLSSFGGERGKSKEANPGEREAGHEHKRRQGIGASSKAKAKRHSEVECKIGQDVEVAAEIAWPARAPRHRRDRPTGG